MKKVSRRVHCRGKLEPADSVFLPNSILGTIPSFQFPQNIPCNIVCFSPQSHPRNNPILPISTKPSMQSCLFFSPITSYDEQLHPISPNLYKVVYLMVPVFFSPIPSYDKQFRLRLHKTFPKNCLMVLCLFPNIIILEPILCYDKLSPKNCLFISFCLHTQMLNSILIISKTLPSKTFNNQFQFVFQLKNLIIPQA